MLGGHMGNTNERIRFQWSWQSNNDSPSTNEEEEAQFIPYTSDINEMIELAYLSHKDEVIINEQYKIDFTTQMQISLNDDCNRRPVIRQEVGLQCRNRARSRNNRRFQGSATAVRTFNVDTEFRGCDFIVDWFKWITNGTLKIDKSTIIDLTIDGILTEAKLYSDDAERISEDVDRFVKELRKFQRVKELALIQEVCVRFYTEDAFFYRIVNETLRNNDRSKFETLGPFCYLLYNYSGSSNNKHGKLPKKIVLYRGEPLPVADIEKYKAAVGSNIVWRWTQFVSTSKQRSVAERFSNGNSLYVIEMKQRSASDQGVYIGSISEFAAEDEVLLRPGIRFKIIKIEYDEKTGKNLFYIDIIPSYMSNLN